MTTHWDISDLEFEKQFKNCEFNPSLFSHEAHLRLAWIHISKYGIEAAEKNIQNQLKAFVNHIGAKEKYNKTLTLAAIKAVYHFNQKSVSKDFKNFNNEFPRLKNNFKELMSLHYSFDIYNSPKAKAFFLKPDLLPFS